MTPPESDSVRKEVEIVLASWELELRALVEIRCERHGRDVQGPSFAVILTSLAVLEALLTIFEWDSTRSIDNLISGWIDQRTKLGDDYARRLWDTYRNGLAHLFAPKQKGGLTNIVRWAEQDGRPCVDGFRKAEFFQVTVRLTPEINQPPGHFTMYGGRSRKGCSRHAPREAKPSHERVRRWQGLAGVAEASPRNREMTTRRPANISLDPTRDLFSIE